MTLPGPRVVEVAYYDADLESDSLERYGMKTKPPIILHIYRESRREALRYFTLSFGSESWASEIYFDFSIDTLLLNCLAITENEDINTRFIEEAIGIEQVQTIANWSFTCFLLEDAVGVLAKKSKALNA